jgi:hypothetical protein
MATELSCWLRRASALASAAAAAPVPDALVCDEVEVVVVLEVVLAVPLGPAAALLLLDALLPTTKAPAAAAVDWLPVTLAPEVEMKRSRRVSGLCQYCGATSITT